MDDESLSCRLECWIACGCCASAVSCSDDGNEVPSAAPGLMMMRRFGYLWYSRGHPQEQVANNGGDGAAAAQGGGEQQQQIDGEGRGAQEREENNDGN